MKKEMVNAFCITPTVFDNESDKEAYILKCKEAGFNVIGFLEKGIEDLLRASWLMTDNGSNRVVLYDDLKNINLYEKISIFTNEKRLTAAGFQIATLTRGVFTFKSLYDLMGNHEKNIINSKKTNGAIVVAWLDEQSLAEELVGANNISESLSCLRKYCNEKGYNVVDEFMIAQNSGISEEVTRYNLYECLTHSQSANVIVTTDRESFAHCLDNIIISKGIHLDYMVEFTSGEPSTTLLDEILAYPYLCGVNELKFDSFFTTKRQTFLFARLGIVKELVTNEMLYERINILKNKLNYDDLDVQHSALVTPNNIRESDVKSLREALSEGLEYIVICDFPRKEDLIDNFYKSRKSFKIVEIDELRKQGFSDDDIVNKAMNIIKEGYSLNNLLKSKIKNAKYTTFGGFNIVLTDVRGETITGKDSTSIYLSFEHRNSFIYDESIDVYVSVLLNDNTKVLIYRDKIKNTEFRGGNFTRFIIDRMIESNEFLAAVQKSMELLEENTN